MNKTNELTPELHQALAALAAPEVTESFYSDLEARIENSATPRSKPKLIRLRYVLPSLTTVAAAILILVLVSGSSTGPTASPGNSFKNGVAAPPAGTSPVTAFNPTLASQVIRQAQMAYAKVNGISGTAAETNFCAQSAPGNGPTSKTVCDNAHPVKTTTDFRFDDAGDSWLSLKSTNDPLSQEAVGPYATYRPALGQKQTVVIADGNGKSLPKPEIQQLNGVGPESDMAPNVFGDFNLSSLLNGLSLDQNTSVQDTVYNGTPAWAIHVKGLPTDEFGDSPDEVTAIFDKTTLFPLSIDEQSGNKKFKSTVISNLVINPSFNASSFVIAPTGGQRVTTTTETQPWIPISGPQNIAAVVSYKPLVPTWMPDGYVLSSIAVAKDAGASGAEGLNPFNRDVADLTYRRGLQTINFTTRLVGPSPSSWQDPYSEEGQINDHGTDFIVQGGAYNATTAHLQIGFGVTPHVWIVGATLVTTVAGDATADELTHILDSTQRQH